MNHFSEMEATLLSATSQPEEKQNQKSNPRAYPQVVKYMGSKAALLDFIQIGLDRVGSQDKTIVDLFAGAGAISGGFGHSHKIISNDIQSYSATIASVYLKKARKIGDFSISDMAEEIAEKALSTLPPNLRYRDKSLTLAEFNKLETRNRKLIHQEFSSSHHLFTKAYSGTWWSSEQCVWIDAIRQVLDDLFENNKITRADFDFGLTCLLHAMAYTSQGTGHYAQYRDAKTDRGMADIAKYRFASVKAIFDKKFDALLKWNKHNVVDNGHEISSMDYRDRLQTIENAVVYADPPYAFVHYSRFYHAMETLVKYDYPDLQQMRGTTVKGRYRTDRHQSPFCIRTQVRHAFSELFRAVHKNGNELVLSYSNTGMIDINELIELAKDDFGNGYKIEVIEFDHKHMTMGRSADHSRNVRESLVLAKKTV